jgi:hypothetical protein
MDANEGENDLRWPVAAGEAVREGEVPSNIRGRGQINGPQPN